MTDAMDSLIMVVGVLMMASLIPMIFGLVCYVLESMSMYAIAKRRGINHAWLAWIPVLNTWVWGSISDQYKLAARNKSTNRKILLPGLAIVTAILGCVIAFNSMDFYVKAFFAGMFSGIGDVSDEMYAIMGSNLLNLAALGLLTMILGLVQVIYTFVVMYDIYSSCDPANATLYLVLSILLSVTRPFLIFACRNKDLGMPRHSVEPSSYVNPEPTYREPWEN